MAHRHQTYRALVQIHNHGGCLADACPDFPDGFDARPDLDCLDAPLDVPVAHDFHSPRVSYVQTG